LNIRPGEYHDIIAAFLADHEMPFRITLASFQSWVSSHHWIWYYDSMDEHSYEQNTVLCTNMSLFIPPAILICLVRYILVLKSSHSWSCKWTF
jgi:hypothetical protein